MSSRSRSVPQPEQPPRILPPDLQAVILADRAGIEPDRGVVDVLEGPVGREHDAVGADFEHGVVERRRVEIARRGDAAPRLRLGIQRKQLLRVRNAAQRIAADRNQAALDVADIGERR
jgi:hypothetical protein